MTDFVPPTPERLAKNDVIATKKGGKAMSRLRIDYLLDRGVIDDGQHRTCLTVRSWFERFNAQLGCKAFDYGAVVEGDLQAYAADIMDAKSKYVFLIQEFVRDMRTDEILKYASVVCHDSTLRQARVTTPDFKIICDDVQKVLCAMSRM